MKTTFQDFETFFQSFLTTALWSSTDEQDNRKRSLLSDGWEFVEVEGKWQIEAPDGDVTPDTYEYKCEAVDAAWEASGGGCEDTALDANYSPSDFAPEALEVLRAHALSFWCRMWYHLDAEEEFSRSDDKAGSAGHDFWLTSQGHGAGFWDGDWPKYGDMFTKLSKCYPEGINITVGDDGKLHI